MRQCIFLANLLLHSILRSRLAAAGFSRGRRGCLLWQGCHEGIEPCPVFRADLYLQLMFEPFLFECFLPAGEACTEICSATRFFASGIDEHMAIWCAHHAQELAFRLCLSAGHACTQREMLWPFHLCGTGFCHTFLLLAKELA